MGEGHFTYFFNQALEFLGLLLYPWKFWKKQSFTPGNSGNLCYTPGKFHIFSLSPLDIVHIHTMSSIHLEIPCLHNPCIFFFFGIAHYICLNCYFSRFCRKFYKVFFLIIPSDVSKGSLGIPLPTPKETDMRRGSKLNVGNYLVDEISRIFFYIACKVQNLLS